MSIRIESKNLTTPYKYLSLLGMLYITSLLLTAVLVHKMLVIHNISISGGTFVYPFSYFFGDIIAEVYGYKIARQLIWCAFICMFFFDMGAASISHTTHPPSWQFQTDYDVVLGPLPRIFVGDFLAISAGAFVNAYVISKCKVLTRGKYFWLRSIGSSCLGEAVFNIIAFSIMFLGVVSFKIYLEVMLFSYFFKVSYSVFAAWPATCLMRILKKLENTDVYDYNTNFNPFRFDI